MNAIGAEEGSILIRDLSWSQPLLVALPLPVVTIGATRVGSFTVHVVVQGHEEDQAAAKDRAARS
jgi:hypothetical protein